jgi:hypothetical protein
VALIKRREKPVEEPVVLPVRSLDEIEEELVKNGALATRMSYVDRRWAPLHDFINELLTEWQETKAGLR